MNQFSCTLSTVMLVLTYFFTPVANSDNIFLRYRRQTNNGCELPQHPRYGKWTIFKSSTTFEPGMFVPSGTILVVQCKDKFKLTGSRHIPCLDEIWSEPIGLCQKTCPSRSSTAVMSIACTYNGVPLRDCINPIEGTIARLKCADFYEDLSLTLHPTHICKNGKWNYGLPECEPICGQKAVTKPTLIVNGQDTTILEHPWQAAIYNAKSKVLICGGSLINQRMIITAAHCITGENGNLQSAEMYNVAVGKYYRQMNDTRDHNVAQFSAVQDMFIPDLYRGEIQNYQADIAIVVTKKTFTLSSIVQPVCVDWELKYHHNLINPSTTLYGDVSGWGYTFEYKHPSDELKYLKVPLVSKEECEKHLPENYERFLTHDKLCAGFLNASTSVCRGDSGGGLIFRYSLRYYIMGVVSNSPQAATAHGGCDSQRYSLYTRVTDYISLILEKDAEFKQIEDDAECEEDPESCLVPTTSTTETPETSTKDSNKPQTTGDKCKLESTGRLGECKLFSDCEKAKIYFQENKLLPELCGIQGREPVVCCEGPRPPGEISQQKCREYAAFAYEEKTGEDASKGEKIECSSKKVTTTGGTIPAKRKEFPHMALVGYDSTSSGIKWLMCSGTIISNNFILTAAHCLITRDYGPAKYVRLGVTTLNDTNGLRQDIAIADLISHPEYKSSSFYNDIGLLRLEKSVTFNSYARPACLHFKYDIPDETALASGWGDTVFGGVRGEDLLKVRWKLFDNAYCNNSYKTSISRKLRNGILDEIQLCAGPDNNEGNSCLGGSGIPLQIYHTSDGVNCMYEVIGVSSFGKPCIGNNPEVFIRVSNYIPWIESIVWPT